MAEIVDFQPRKVLVEVQKCAQCSCWLLYGLGSDDLCRGMCPVCDFQMIVRPERVDPEK